MRIANLINRADRPFFSFEFFPPSQPEQLPQFYETAAALGRLAPLFVSVTYGAGGSRQQNTLSVTASLAQMGLTVMAHLTCVGATFGAVASFVSDLLRHGVENVLALRGDPPKIPIHAEEALAKAQALAKVQPSFLHAADLVRFLRQNFPRLGIGVAAYPAPHPEAATFEQDRQYTAEKLAAGADFAITQVFFDTREYLELLTALRRKGITAPVVPGILPIQSLDSLRRVLSLCGANIPGKFYLELERAHEQGGQQAVREAGIAFALQQIRQLLDAGAPGIHLYTLNRNALCERLLAESHLI